MVIRMQRFTRSFLFSVLEFIGSVHSVMDQGERKVGEVREEGSRMDVRRKLNLVKLRYVGGSFFEKGGWRVELI